ncbi:alkaline phosphatase D [Novosphingobium kunmingense]|uniref:Alkaline phosphatase D n=1 Tax=Novosphingobium kunmingense TaxID=1211806 RepID=A0A2N0H5E9_9SPHN|nr:alkaline phosphatase D family protein [Novosphingobium kunmingense]PKB14181.1 alkaline phosphatase D [Novosphingobium kunmingense]
MPPECPPLAASLATRRSALKLAGLGLIGLGAPLGAVVPVSGFTHGVASGEPAGDRVLLWTRYAAAGNAELRWEVSDSLDFSRIAAGGTVIASPASDGCTKVTATGLRPDSWYYYRFVGPDGAVSDVGRTRTLPVDAASRFRVAVFSCANFGFGFFNAYAHAAEAGDFDLVVHTGDYLYEYPRGEYPSARDVLPGREAPPEEMVTLAQYRARFAQYRSDPDLQRIHQLYPMVAMWDDHETANDTWAGGAQNHQANEGDWQTRKRISEQVYREWMPVSDAPYAAYEIGDLASLYRLESRHLARSQPLDLLGVAKAATAAEADARLAGFRDGAWADPARTLLGTAQESWLATSLRASTRARKPWQVLGQQIVMGSLVLPDSVTASLPAKAPDWLRDRLIAYQRAGRDGLPFNMDAWDGYPAARDRLYRAALDADANLIVLSGDSHNAWAFDLDRKGARVGVEMAGHSVTSPGAEGSLAWIKPDALARDVVARNPQLKWCDTARRGYLAVDLTPHSATGEWRFLSSVRQRGTALADVQRMVVLAGQRRFSA